MLSEEEKRALLFTMNNVYPAMSGQLADLILENRTLQQENAKLKAQVSELEERLEEIRQDAMDRDLYG